jgi:2-polyprenyl-3-methyl-5-hydroxy-6-metoxy-1,4-benzoquinol methylase
MKEPNSGLTEKYLGKSDVYYAQQRPEMLEFIPQKVSTVLEVGCGSGEFAESIKKNRTNSIVWGIEPSKEAADAASRKVDNVVWGMFEADSPALKGKRFDCIVFNDVLEHLPDPETVLRDCRRYLTESGCVVASIPNILFFYEITKILIEEDWEYKEHGILDNTHLRFFTRKSIIRMFESVGYDVELIKGINGFAGKKYKIANFLTMGRLKDWKYLQFAVRARPSK